MALTADQIRAELISRGTGRGETTAALGNTLEGVLELWSNSVIEDLVAYLDTSKRSGTTLGQSIVAVPTKTAEGRQIEIQAPSYWNYVDEGVNGLESNVGSRFSFNFPSVSKSHAEAIANWIPKVGIQPRGEQTFLQVAYAIAASSKKKGINPTPFVTDTITEARIGELEKAILKVTGEIIKINFKNGGNNRN